MRPGERAVTVLHTFAITELIGTVAVTIAFGVLEVTVPSIALSDIRSLFDGCALTLCDRLFAQLRS